MLGAIVEALPRLRGLKATGQIVVKAGRKIVEALPRLRGLKVLSRFPCCYTVIVEALPRLRGLKARGRKGMSIVSNCRGIAPVEGTESLVE